MLAIASTAAADIALGETTANVRPDFSGLWLINPALSDDVETKLKELQQIAMFQREREWTQKREKETSSGKKRLRRRSVNREKMEQRLVYIPDEMDFLIDDVRQHFHSIRSIRIRHSDPLLRLRSDDGKSRRIYTDGRGAKIRAMGGVDQLVSFAGWEGELIVVESQLLRNLKLKETFSIDAKTGQLGLQTVYTNANTDDTVEINVVYDPQRNQP